MNINVQLKKAIKKAGIFSYTTDATYNKKNNTYNFRIITKYNISQYVLNKLTKIIGHNTQITKYPKYYQVTFDAFDKILVITNTFHNSTKSRMTKNDIIQTIKDNGNDYTISKHDSHFTIIYKFVNFQIYDNINNYNF